MWAYIVLTIAVVGCSLTAILCRRYVGKSFEDMDAILDRILARDEGMRRETLDEDGMSKLNHKANRILDMCLAEVEQSKGEKETIQAFISDMSHQMKTPLAGVSMYSELLLEGGVSGDEQEEFLRRIKAGTEKLQWMMECLIKMSRLEVGAIQLAPVPTGVKRTISLAIGDVLAAAAKKNVNIEVAELDDVTLYHDGKWTREALANVLENAVKYSMPNGVVEVAVETMPMYTKIIVTDHGVGIPKEDWNKIFKRFYRGQNVRDEEGAGLGLYLATLVLEKQGGYIMVDSVPERFTSFSLFLQNCKE